MRILDIKGFIPNTMLDWEGMLASTIFLPRCNFRCPFCQNTELVLHPERLQSVPLSAITAYIADRAGWVEGVCVTGGEPMLDPKRTARIISELRKQNERASIYLYTALYDDAPGFNFPPD